MKRTDQGRGHDSLVRLKRLAREGATGELICAMAEAEVHIHLQRGRIAWATSSLSRLAFARHVADECDIDAAAFRELVLECQRERKPLGETLIAWGVASASQVRTALERQIVEAVSTLGAAAETVFLQRGSGYRNYNEDFTFHVDKICQRLPSTSPRVSPAATSRASISSLPPPDGPRARLRSLVLQEPDIRWAEYYQGGRLHDVAPPDQRRDARSELLADVIPGVAASIVIRSQEGNVLGFGLEDASECVFCGVAPSALVSALQALAEEHMGGSRRAERQAIKAPAAAAIIGEDRGIPRAMLGQAMARSEELSAVLLVDTSHAPHLLAWRQSLRSDDVSRRVSSLSELLRGLAESRPERLDRPEDYPFLSVGAECPGSWLFGGELLDGTDRYLFIALRSDARQGLGWALLTALLRRTSLTRRELGR